MNHFSKSIIILCGIGALAAAAQAQVYKYEVNKPYAYIGESKESVKQIAQGRTVNVTSEMTAAFTFTVSEYLPDGSMKAILDIKSAVIFAESPQGMETAGEELANTSTIITVDQEGHVTDVDSSVMKFKLESQGVLQRVSEFLPNINGEKIAAGESWTQATKDTSGTEKFPLFIEREIEYEADGTADIAGISSLKINAAGEVSMNGEIESRGQNLTVLGEGVVTGEVYYSTELGIMTQTKMDMKLEEVYTNPNNPSQQVTITRTSSNKFEYVAD